MKPVLGAFLVVLFSCGPVLGQRANQQAESFLYEPMYCLDNEIRGKARAYLPKPGDVMLATDKNLFWKVTHAMALAFEPHNSAIVVSRCDGSLATLEAGPNDTIWIRRLDMLPHLKEYADKGPVWIRKRKTPLTKAQESALAEFAEKQDGKRFALGRLAVQLTPFRDRGPVRTRFMGGTHGDRASYYCSELVLEACVAAGLTDPRTTRPSASYPRDLFFDWSFNPYINRHAPLCQDWEPPARWLDCDVSDAHSSSRRRR